MRIPRKFIFLLAIAPLFTITAACSSDEPTPTTEPEPTSTNSTPIPGFLPTWPQIYSGTLTAGGQPVPDGYSIVGRVEEYSAPPITTANSRYFGLSVAPFDESLWDKPVIFHLISPGGNEVEAEETDLFHQRNSPVSDTNFNLTFPGLP